MRGIYKDWHSSTTTDPEVTNVNTLQRFLNGGVQVGNDVQVNTASESYVAWNWYMETAGSGSSNTDGSINTTSTLVDTNSVISIGTSGIVNGSSLDYVCYAFAPSQFISIGSYIGNGNANGSFVPTINSLGIPIQPAWFLTKNTTEAESWNLQDTARHPDNEVDISLFPNSTATDTAGYDKDFVTGGFKMRTTNAGVNKSGITYVYLAFGTPLIDVDGRIITGF